MRPNTISLGLATSLVLLTTATGTLAFALPSGQQERLPLDTQKLAQLRETNRREQQDPPRQDDPATGYPIVQEDTWVFEDDLPWSELVMVQRESQANYVAIPDRSYETGPGADLRNPGIASLWSHDRLFAVGYGIEQVYFMGFICDTEHPVFPVSAASLKVGDQIFTLRGRRSAFEISDQIAWALKTAEPDQVWLRVAIAGGSNYTTRPIGADTIAAFQTIYQNAEPTEVAALPETSMGSV